MKNVLFVLFVLILQSTNTQQYQTSSFGRNFVFGVIGSGVRLSSTNLRLHITPVTEIQALVRVTAPFINMDRTYTVSNYTIVPLDGTLIQFENGTQFKGIEVSSNANISVTVVSNPGDYTEGFLALPINALGSRYVTASYTVYRAYSSEILIAGVESDTDVTLKIITTNNASSIRSFRLQKFETYQFKSTSDISGSTVTSNKPVAVVSGSAVAMVPVGSGSLQYLVEQMIPTKYWTSKFIIPSIYPRKHFVLRLFADQNNTEVNLYNSSKHFAVHMDKGSMEELLFGTDPVVVIADKPVSVIQYGHDGDHIDGDPFMVNTQGITQFQESYRFVTQNYYYHTGSNTIAITLLKNSTSGLLLNGHSMSYWSAKNVSVSPPMDEYITFFVNVSSSSFYNLHHSGGKRFGAIIYGRPGTSAAYGYPLQLSLIENGKGTWCFQCEDMAHLKYCDKVSKCQNENEVCFVQRYTRSLDVTLFRSGCAHLQQCSNSDGNGTCFKCCDGDFCNSVGCGDDGFPAPGQRGPICFDCTHKGEGEECNTVQLCHSNQVCMIEKYEWGDDDFHYIRGCNESQVCSRKRHAPVCSHCCHSDFCNMNCTSVDTAPPIVG